MAGQPPEADRNGWTAYVPLEGTGSARLPSLHHIRVVDETAIGSMLVVRFTWRLDPAPREYLLAIDMSDVLAGHTDGAAVRVLDRLAELVGSADWTIRRVTPLGPTVALVISRQGS